MSKNPFKSIRFLLLISCVTISLLMITNIIPLNRDKGVGAANGLDFGIDFAGGTQMQLRLEEEVESDVMALQKNILENRLNSLGLRDIPVRPWGSQYILITIAESTPDEITRIENIIKEQARFEERIDGELAALGEEVTVDLGPRGTELYRTTGGYNWGVAVMHNREGACRFGQVGDGKRGRPVDMFIDRPENTSIIISQADWDLLANLSESSEADSFFFGDTALEIITERARIPVLPLTNDTHIIDTLTSMMGEGYTNVILAGSNAKISDALRNRLEESGIRTVRNPLEEQSYIAWVTGMIGLENSLRLDFDPRGECVYNARISGGAPTLEQAQYEIQRTKVLLMSGNLPVKVTVESKSTTPPTLGRKFLAYSLYTGVAAILAVGIVILLRYRRKDIVLPVVYTSASEVIMILGLAAFINWELDLPALAGIIASVGTGVDHLVVITDGTLKKTQQKRLLSIKERISRAFFIIFVSAATMIAAMLPLLSIGAGMLKGFAFTTIMGVLIGIIISRPAYAKIIEAILEKEE
jgi:preprotein translocase subunit SecD